MPNKQQNSPLVSSVSTQLRKTVDLNNTSPITPDELKEKKQKLMGILDNATLQFIKNLEEGKVELTSSLDLERIVKLTLLLSGEADTITGSSLSQGELETTVGTSSAELSMSKVEEILNLDDPDVKAMFDKLYEGYNEKNNEKA